MGDYTFMQGKVCIKDQFVDEFARFLKGYEDTRALDWNSLNILELKSNIGYKLLCHDRIGHWMPFGLSAISPFEGDSNGFAVMDGNTLEFHCGFKNYRAAQEAFIVLLPIIADDWDIEQDVSECHFFAEDTIIKYNPKELDSQHHALDVVVMSAIRNIPNEIHDVKIEPVRHPGSREYQNDLKSRLVSTKTSKVKSNPSKLKKNKRKLQAKSRRVNRK